MMWSAGAFAQQQAWVQIEAQPTRAEAEERAGAYAEAFPNVVGYQLASRWYGIALGPFSRGEAEATLRSLLSENMIPPDSFISDGSNFRQPFWPPEGGAGDAATALAPVTGNSATDAPDETTQPQTDTTDAAAAVPPDEETVAEARASEALLSLTERQDLQSALQWQGFYGSAIDGAFGPGTRSSMADWQTVMGFDSTGVLTTSQRQMLIDGWQADLAQFGFETVTETEAGIEIVLPMGMVTFDHYEPPFVHFPVKNNSGLRVILISQPGDQAMLYGLYDILQSLTIVPPEGERSRGERSFEINAANATVASHAYAELSQGLIKGYILVWNPAVSDKAQRVLSQMKASFRPVGNRALDPGMVAMDAAVREGLLAGLEVRKPRHSRSGFFVSPTGHVATSLDTVAQCGRITLDGVTDATLMASDATAGLALLAPKTPLSPPAVGMFQITPDRIGTEIAVAGYSYEDTLPAPAMTFGTLADVTGLNGEAGIKRLGIKTLPGDVGGPLIDGTGAVLGMLLPKTSDGTRVLPEGVEFAVSAPAITAMMVANGLTPVEAPAQGALAPEDLTRKAMGMTVLVGCWE